MKIVFIKRDHKLKNNNEQQVPIKLYKIVLSDLNLMTIIINWSTSKKTKLNNSPTHKTQLTILSIKPLGSMYIPIKNSAGIKKSYYNLALIRIT